MEPFDAFRTRLRGYFAEVGRAMEAADAGLGMASVEYQVTQAKIALAAAMREVKARRRATQRSLMRDVGFACR